MRQETRNVCTPTILPRQAERPCAARKGPRRDYELHGARHAIVLVDSSRELVGEMHPRHVERCPYQKHGLRGGIGGW